MPYYFVTLILLIISIILTGITFAVEGKKRVVLMIGTATFAVSTVISFTTMSIPKPEIYTTTIKNGREGARDIQVKKHPNVREV